MDTRDTADGRDDYTGPELVVVVCTLGKTPMAATLDSIAASASKAGRAVEIVVVWQGAEQPPLPEGVRVLDVFPLGISYARNRGLAAVGGRFVGFLDDDELVGEEWVAGALAELAGDSSLDGAFGPVLPTEPGSVPYFCPTQERVLFQGDGELPWLVGTGGNMVFPRETLVRAGGFDPRFGAGGAVGSAEETDLVLRFLREGRRLVYTPELSVYHPSRSEQDEIRARHVYGIGMGIALRRSPVLSGKYLYTIGQELGRSVRGRDTRRRREVLATLRSFLTGLVAPVRARSPAAALDRLPGELRALLGDKDPRPLTGTIGERAHLRYALGGGRVLHLYVNPASGLEELLDSSPELVAHATGRDAVWALQRGSRRA